MIIGFGTGRCGTVSLSHYFDTWHEFRTDNEFLSELDDHAKTKWFISLAELSRKYNKTFGDISLDHINNLDYWLAQDVDRIVLMRDRGETIQSIANHSKRIFKRLFPQFDFDTEKGIGEYWDWYYDTILEHEDKFIIISPEQINIRKNQHEKTNKPQTT